MKTTRAFVRTALLLPISLLSQPCRSTGLQGFVRMWEARKTSMPPTDLPKAVIDTIFDWTDLYTQTTVLPLLSTAYRAKYGLWRAIDGDRFLLHRILQGLIDSNSSQSPVLLSEPVRNKFMLRYVIFDRGTHSSLCGVSHVLLDRVTERLVGNMESFILSSILRKDAPFSDELRSDEDTGKVLDFAIKVHHVAYHRVLHGSYRGKCSFADQQTIELAMIKHAMAGGVCLMEGWQYMQGQTDCIYSLSFLQNLFTSVDIRQRNSVLRSVVLRARDSQLTDAFLGLVLTVPDEAKWKPLALLLLAEFRRRSDDTGTIGRIFGPVLGKERETAQEALIRAADSATVEDDDYEVVKRILEVACRLLGDSLTLKAARQGKVSATRCLLSVCGNCDSTRDFFLALSECSLAAAREIFLSAEEARFYVSTNLTYSRALVFESDPLSSRRIVELCHTMIPNLLPGDTNGYVFVLPAEIERLILLDHSDRITRIFAVPLLSRTYSGIGGLWGTLERDSCMRSEFIGHVLCDWHTPLGLLSRRRVKLQYIARLLRNPPTLPSLWPSDRVPWLQVDYLVQVLLRKGELYQLGRPWTDDKLQLLTLLMPVYEESAPNPKGSAEDVLLQATLTEIEKQQHEEEFQAIVALFRIISAKTVMSYVVRCPLTKIFFAALEAFQAKGQAYGESLTRMKQHGLVWLQPRWPKQPFLGSLGHLMPALREHNEDGRFSVILATSGENPELELYRTIERLPASILHRGLLSVEQRLDCLLLALGRGDDALAQQMLAQLNLAAHKTAVVDLLGRVFREARWSRLISSKAILSMRTVLSRLNPADSRKLGERLRGLQYALLTDGHVQIQVQVQLRLQAQAQAQAQA